MEVERCQISEFKRSFNPKNYAQSLCGCQCPPKITCMSKHCSCNCQWWRTSKDSLPTKNSSDICRAHTRRASQVCAVLTCAWRCPDAPLQAMFGCSGDCLQLCTVLSLQPNLVLHNMHIGKLLYSCAAVWPQQCAVDIHFFWAEIAQQNARVLAFGI